jgi:hypothetical protein
LYEADEERHRQVEKAIAHCEAETFRIKEDYELLSHKYLELR